MSKNKGKDKKVQSVGKQKHIHVMAFDKDNYRWMLIGVAIIVIGFVLMAGKTDDLFDNAEVFQGGDVSFSTKLKVSVAPIVVLLGFIVEVYAILKKPVEANEPA